MISRALVLAAAACAACHDRTPPPRQRVLERIPGDAQLVIVADGAVLAQPRMRGVIDALRPRWPARFGCVIDAALAGDHVAIGITATRDMTVVISTRAPVTCAALSQLGGGLHVATLGAGKPATTGSVLDDPAHARARTYLLSAPIAAEILLPGVRVLATASPEPLEAWLAIDTIEAASALAEQKVRGVLDKLARIDATAPFASHVEVSHEGSQVIARLHGPVDADLALAVRAVLARYAAPAVRAAAGFECPPLGPPIIGCAGGTALDVTDIAAAAAPLLDAPVTPIIENERVAWLRLDAPVASLGLRKGDLLLAVDGRHLDSVAQLRDLLTRARDRASITIQRDAVTATLELTRRAF